MYYFYCITLLSTASQLTWAGSGRRLEADRDGEEPDANPDPAAEAAEPPAPPPDSWRSKDPFEVSQPK
mgnify:CR=1 FL=1